ncbi:endonuclease [bacterium]|nr:endonuclease [bacterium]
MNRLLSPRSLSALVLAWLCATIAAPAARADVLISELCDPRLDYLTDRYIEVWNSGPATVDLTGWQITAIGNGVDIFTWTLSGSIAPGQALVAGDTATMSTFQVDFAAASWSDNTTTWNGKIGDGARLKNGSGTVVDEIVAPGTLFENLTLVRNEGVVAPSTSYIAAEWTGTAVDYPTEATPGTHWSIGPDGPVIGTPVASPANPLATDTVAVQATVTDALATITGVELAWGTSAASQPNTIGMTDLGGGLYGTTTDIPAQAGGTTVHYRITASNDAPATTVSDLFSYVVTDAVTIAQIQGAGATSPYVGQSVQTTGVVTANDGTFHVIQDGTGPRSGLWVAGTGGTIPPGTAVTVSGMVGEADGNTVLTGDVVAGAWVGLPAPQVLTTGAAAGEDWEGVLVRVENAACTVSSPGAGLWAVDNGGGDLRVAGTAVSGLILGTVYTITGPVNGAAGAGGGIVPDLPADIVWVADTAAPAITDVSAPGPLTVLVTFSEAVSPATAQVAANYTLDGGAVTSVVLAPGRTDQVELSVAQMATGSHTLVVDGVTDAYGNAMAGVPAIFPYYGGNIPAGYYDTAEGLTGETLRGALHDIIDGHTTISYDGLYGAYYTTDVKPNGKVWDMYSDVPGGTPPYEYDFGVDEGGDPGAEGTGYNREHTWPSSWYGGSGTPYTDVFIVLPTDNRVNNFRSNYPYGETDAPDWTSLNGSKRGPCSYPGYTGVIFEPIDGYKGDFARIYFYFSTRYYGEDAGWPGSPGVDGSQLLEWTKNMMLEWNAADPVDQKEIDRNEAVYAIQGNRNPFVDRPDFVQKVFQPGLSPVAQPLVPAATVLFQNAPNPFNPSTTIRYELPAAGVVDLRIYDVAGRLVRALHHGVESAGPQEKTWLGRDERGQPVASGVYFYRLVAGDEVQTRRMLLAK